MNQLRRSSVRALEESAADAGRQIGSGRLSDLDARKASHYSPPEGRASTQFMDSPDRSSSWIRGAPKVDPPARSNFVDMCVGGDEPWRNSSAGQSAELIVGSAEAIVGQMFDA